MTRTIELSEVEKQMLTVLQWQSRQLTLLNRRLAQLRRLLDIAAETANSDLDKEKVA